MTNSLEALIASMKAAAEKATSGEWLLQYGDGDDPFESENAVISREVQGFMAIAKIEGAHPDSGFDEEFQQEQQANAEFIHAWQPENALALIAALEQSQQKADVYDLIREDYSLTGSVVEFVDWQAQRIAGLEKRLRETEETLIAATDQVTELEAAAVKPVKLPEELDFDYEFENGDFDIYEEPYLRGRVAGFNEAICKIRRAGIQVEGE